MGNATQAAIKAGYSKKTVTNGNEKTISKEKADRAMLVGF
ncbi:hypothetical protein [Lactobacillus taiwanensis]|nr:hypothetical protein [Lactobacillus taiwanensis]